MAVFTNLHDVATLFVEHIRASYTGSPPTIRVGFVPESAASTTEEVRVTLLWVTQQPTHRNDPWERGPDGTKSPPPVTLTLVFLVTTYGDDGVEPAGAYRLLGEVLQAVHSRPSLRLPEAAPLDLGEGPLDLVQMPVTPELMEKVFTPLQGAHRPWALFELGPVQLGHLSTERPALGLVRPGGVNLGGPEAAPPPVLEALWPAQQLPGGRLRLEVDTLGLPLAAVWFGTTRVDDSLVTQLDGTLLVPVPTSLGAGAVRVSVEVENTALDPASQFTTPLDLLVFDSADNPVTVDAHSALEHDPALPLDLSGANLAGVTRAWVWPHEGVASPADIVELAVAGADVTATTVRIQPAALVTAPTGVTLRLVVETDGPFFSAPILLVLAP